MINVDELIHWIKLSFPLEPWQERVLREIFSEDDKHAFSDWGSLDGDNAV